jgi:molybdopterin synthase sulfur carrier subunit
MPRVVFTRNLRRHVDCPEGTWGGATVRGALALVFAANPQVRSYVLDDQGLLRQHMAVFVDGKQVEDRRNLADEVLTDSEIYVMQALSGG